MYCIIDSKMTKIYVALFSYVCSTVGLLFSRATNFENVAKKGVRGNNFHETTLTYM